MPTKPGHITSERARYLASRRKTLGHGKGAARKMVICPRCGIQVLGVCELKYNHPKVCARRSP